MSTAAERPAGRCAYCQAPTRGWPERCEWCAPEMFTAPAPRRTTQENDQ